MKKIQLQISGMSCAACSARMEKVLNRMPGIADAAVNLMAAKAFISYDEAIINEADIKAAIEKIGFGVVEEKQQEKQLYPISALIISVCATIVLMYVSMGGHMLGLPLPAIISHHTNPLGFALSQFILTLPVLIAGRRFYLVGLPALWRRDPNMDSLVAIGTSAAMIYSIYSLIRIAGGEAEYIGQLYFETAVMIITLVMVGKFLEERAKGRANSALQKLLDLAPEQAIIEKNGQEQTIASSQVAVDDIVVIKPGMRLPVDGVVIEGISSIDESFLTGESIPREVMPGALVNGGAINGAGYFKFRAQKIGTDTMLAQIARLMEEAQSDKAPISRLADRVAARFVPIVLLIAIVSATGWLIAGQDITFCLRIFIAVLVISCPCALGLATPTAITVGMGKAAELGILIKSGAALESMAHIDILAFDKTGTITEGKPVLTEIATHNGIDTENALILAASLEKASEHPLAEALLTAAKERNLSLLALKDQVILPGFGISGIMEDGKVLRLGNSRFLEQENIDTLSLEEQAVAWREQGRTVMYLAQNQQLLAIIGVADRIKEGNVVQIGKLQQDGYQTMMLTGDNTITAAAIGKSSGIDEIVSDLLPGGKVAEIKNRQQNGLVIAMIGDGINDAPALKQADIGIAVGNGADIAIEAADIILLRDNLSALNVALQLSRYTLRIIKQNLGWAFCYNIAGIPIAAGLLYLFGGPLLEPIFGAAAMSLSSVSVVSNALRIRRYKER